MYHVTLFFKGNTCPINLLNIKSVYISYSDHIVRCVTKIGNDVNFDIEAFKIDSVLVRFMDER